MTARPASRPPASARAGFTLLELLTVILIISILIAVAFPAYTAVMRSTRVATARSELASIESAIAEFKAKFNTDPPSYISFVPVGAGTELPPATKATLRQMFPQIDFTQATTTLGTLGLMGKELRGSEALVFFLGGVRAGTTNELTGFSKNPANPFLPPTTGSGRIGPFFEFKTDRLGEVTRSTTAPFIITNFNTDPASFTGNPLAYASSLPGQTLPLLYASTAGTGAYDQNHVPDLTAGAYKKSATGGFWNPNSYQLIAPGFDSKYGLGGVYQPGSGSSAALKEGGADNLTNFVDGLLEG